MEAMPQSWTDDRLDNFRGEVAGRFDGVDRRFEQVDERFDRMDERFDVVNGRFDLVNEQIKEVGGRMGRLEERMGRLEARFSSWERTIFQLGVATIVTFVVGFAGVIATLIALLL